MVSSKFLTMLIDLLHDVYLIYTCICFSFIIAPVPIENNISSELSEIVSNVMVVGDKRKYLTCLITLKCKMDKYGVPTNCLEDGVTKWCKQFCSEPIITVEDFEKNSKLSEHIQKGLECANEKAQANPNKVQKFAILPKDFSVQGTVIYPKYY